MGKAGKMGGKRRQDAEIGAFCGAASKKKWEKNKKKGKKEKKKLDARACDII